MATVKPCTNNTSFQASNFRPFSFVRIVQACVSLNCMGILVVNVETRTMNGSGMIAMTAMLVVCAMKGMIASSPSSGVDRSAPLEDRLV